MERTDCFAYQKTCIGACCTALKDVFCKNEENCSFYCNKEEYEKKLEKQYGTSDIEEICSYYARRMDE